MLLLADKAVYWPNRNALLIADPHFGKAAAFRAMGQPVPHGTTSSNIQRLDALVTKYQVHHLIILGDFLHSAHSHAPSTLTMLHEWRNRNASLHCTLIRGNHDHRAGDPPSTLAMEVVDEPLVLDGIALQHIPDRHPKCHVIAGHLHPVFRLQGRARQSLRLPCYHTSKHLTLLPAFGDFTGGKEVPRRRGTRIFLTDGLAIWPLPPA